MSDEGLDGYKLVPMHNVITLNKGNSIILHLNGDIKSEIIPELNELNKIKGGKRRTRNIRKSKKSRKSRRKSSRRR